MTETTVILVATLPPSILAASNIIINVLNRKQSQLEHLQTKSSVDKLGGTVATIEKNTNDKLDTLLRERNAEAKRADELAGHQEGVRAEQERTTKGT